MSDDTKVAEDNAKPLTPAGVEAAELRLKLETLTKRLDDLMNPPVTEVLKPVKLDLGCGSGERKREGYLGVDAEQRLNKDGSPGIDVVCDLTVLPWPWADNSVDEVNCSHVLEHIPAEKTDYKLGKDENGEIILIKTFTRPRVAFFNELYRIMKKGAQAHIVTPHWCSNRAYGDITHCWPAVSEMFWFYLDKEWRKVNTPHLDENQTSDPTVFHCDFSHGWGYNLANWLDGRNQEYQEAAVASMKEAAQDMCATITKK